MKKYLILFTPIIIFAKMHIMQKEFHITSPIKSWIEFKNENLTRQKHDYSCGASSLSTVMKYYYDQNISEKAVLNKILEIRGTDKSRKKSQNDEEENILSFLDLSQYVQTKGFKALGLALDINALKKLKAPVILYVKIRKNEHFTVFRGMDENHVYLADPSFGNAKIKIAKFKEMFYQREDLKYPGKVLAILPLDPTTPHTDFMKIKKNANIIYEVIDRKTIR